MISAIDPSRSNVRNFGLLFGVLCLGLSVFLVWKGSQGWIWWAGGGAAFLAASTWGYPVLRPLYIGWMTFAFVLGWINTRVILGLFFFLVLTPIGFILRAMGKDLLDEKIDKNAPTYWIRRDPQQADPKRCERLF